MKKLLTVFAIIFVIGGLGYMASKSKAKFEHHSLLQDIHHKDHAHKADSLHGTVLQNEIDSMEFVKVHSQDPKVKSFFTQFRTKDILSFPCQNCHNVPLSQMKTESNGAKKAHWDIEIKHANNSVMKCNSCHKSDDMNYLNSLSGESISIDHSFELCAQCHSTQYKDWLGGAHGKSLNGWRPPRVAKTCVNCHNPHDPSIKSRWPSRLVKEEQNDLK